MRVNLSLVMKYGETALEVEAMDGHGNCDYDYISLSYLADQLWSFMEEKMKVPDNETTAVTNESL